MQGFSAINSSTDKGQLCAIKRIKIHVFPNMGIRSGDTVLFPWHCHLSV